MINKVRNHPVLSMFIEETCCENGIYATVDSTIDINDYVIIKVDKYYNSLRVKTRPSSVDCMILQRCKQKGVGLSLIELKAVHTLKNLTVQDIAKKFENTLMDFIKTRFRNPLDVDYHKVRLYFVTKKELNRRDLGLKMEALMSIRVDFNGKKLMIRPEMPNPTIRNCYCK